MEIELIRKKALPILRQAGVRRAGLFGSAVKSKQLPRDIDMLVEMKKQATLLNFINLKNLLEIEFNQPVDLVEYDAIKPALKTGITRETVELM